MRIWTPTILSLAVMAVATSVQAAVVKNISTGIDDATGTKLAHNVQDTDYVVGSGSTADVGMILMTRETGIPATPPYAFTTDASSIASRWIATVTGVGVLGLDEPPGHYFLQTTVDLTGFDPATAVIPSARYCADNALMGIYVNGVSVYSKSSTSGLEFTSFNLLPDNLGLGTFVSGVNTIRFDVLNTETYASILAFRLEASVTANAVPEPATLGAMAPVAFFLLKRRARKQR